MNQQTSSTERERLLQQRIWQLESELHRERSASSLPNLSSEFPSSSPLPSAAPLYPSSATISGGSRLSSSPSNRGVLNHARRRSVSRTMAPPIAASTAIGTQTPSLTSFPLKRAKTVSTGPPLSNSHCQPMKRAKTASMQQARTSPAVQMQRSSSSMSTTSTPVTTSFSRCGPFSGSGQVTPPPQLPAQRPQQTPTGHGDAKMTERHQGEPSPTTDKGLYNMPSGVYNTMQQPMLSSLTETPVELQDVGMDIPEFLRLQTSETELHSPDLFEELVCDGATTQRLLPFQGYSTTPMSVCGSLTDAPTLDDNDIAMSRQNSNMYSDASMADKLAISMMRIESQNSHLDVPSMQQGHFHFPAGTAAAPSLLGKRTFPVDQQDFSQIGAGPSAQFPQVYSVSTPTFQSATAAMMKRRESSQSTESIDMPPMDYDSESMLVYPPSFHDSTSMERSDSSTSTKSNRSLTHRAKEALKRQTLNAAKAPLLQPKPVLLNPEPDTQAAGAGAAAKAAKDGKTAITAAKKYERPKHPKVKCSICNEYPDGFRGDHELRRHTDAKHKPRVTKWVCRDPTVDDGPGSDLVPLQSLKQCKACSNEKKYGAYYNAAAHLRRTHFMPKGPRGKNAAASNSSDDSGNGREKQSRAGSGGGDWPPMASLKPWIRKLEVSRENSSDDEPNDVNLEDIDREEEEEEDEQTEGDKRLQMDDDASPQLLPMYGVEPLGIPDFNLLDGITTASFHGLSDSGANSLGPNSVSFYDLPISSASFSLGPSLHTTSLVGHGSEMHYHSPSTATITAGNMYEDSPQYSPSTAVNHMAFSPDEQQEFDFNAVFLSGVGSST